MDDLLSVAEGQRLIRSAFNSTEVESVPVHKAAGRVLAENTCTDIDLPPFTNSSMDGFAIRGEDVNSASSERPVSLSVVADIPAGKVTSVKISAGQAARIMTGAALPEGSNAVVPIEMTNFYLSSPGEPAPQQVRVFTPVKPGDYIRPAGQDARRGDTILIRGSRLRAQDVGMLAMLGKTHAQVYRKPRVAIFSSGDELVALGQPLESGKVYDSNSFTLSALIEKYGSEVIPLGVARDDFDSIKKIMDHAVDLNSDLIISSAGVSVGAFDYIRSVVESHGHIGFWRVNMRPGKPLTFGDYRGVPFIGLPGNPVSSFIGFEVFVRPALDKLSGSEETERPYHMAVLDEAVESDGRESYLRGIIRFEDGTWRARLTGHQGSGNLRSLVQANALLLIPSGVKSLPIGTEVKAWAFD